MKRCRKAEATNSSYSMGRKRVTTRQLGDVGWSKGDTGEGTERRRLTLVGLPRILLGCKMKEVHTVDSATTNGL
jgi:hypothetical protein